MLLLTLLATLLIRPFTTASPTPLNTTTPELSLQPWLITRLSTHTPSGFPANHPYSYLSLSITDPNTITLGTTHFGDAAFPPSTANCTVVWLGFTEDPRGWRTACSGMEVTTGKWSVEILEGSKATSTDFVLRFGLAEAVVLGNGGVVEYKFEGEAAFKVGAGENMGGSCGGSGVCNWGLRGEVVPVLVNQTLVERSCVAGECEV